MSDAEHPTAGAVMADLFIEMRAERDRLRAALDEAEARAVKAGPERDAANARATKLEATIIAAAKIGQIVGFLGSDEARIEAFREACGPELLGKARARLGAKP